MEQVLEFLKNCDVYYLATLDGDKPRVRPFGTALGFEGKIYFQTGKVKDVAKQLKANPNIQISGMVGDRWIRLTAEAVLDNREEVQTAMLEEYPELKTLYKVGDSNNEVYYLKNATALICSFNQKPLKFEF